MLYAEPWNNSSSTPAAGSRRRGHSRPHRPRRAAASDVEPDRSCKKIHQALEVLLDESGGRAEKTHPEAVLSLDHGPSWKRRNRGIECTPHAPRAEFRQAGSSPPQRYYASRGISSRGAEYIPEESIELTEPLPARLLEPIHIRLSTGENCVAIAASPNRPVSVLPVVFVRETSPAGWMAKEHRSRGSLCPHRLGLRSDRLSRPW